MRAVSLLAASLFAAPTIAAPEDPWVLLGSTPDVRYDVLRGSIETDVNTYAVEFVLRTTLREPMLSPKAKIEGKVFVERTLVLCREDVLVTMSQLVYDRENKHVATVAKATVYENPNVRGSAATELIRWACTPLKPANPLPVTPVNKRPDVMV